MNWGDKLILVLLRARYVSDEESLVNHIKNLCCHLKVKNVKVYWSNVFVNNIYYTDAFYGTPAIIIGKNLYNDLSRNELVSLLNASILKIKTNEAERKTLSSLLFVILYSPFLLLMYLFRKTRINFLTQIFLYPVYMFKAKCYEDEKLVLAFDKEVAQLDGLRSEYVAALFKISSRAEIFENTITSIIVNELTHIKNKNNDLVSSTIVGRVDRMDRIKNLSSH